jgi:hypothetical protein
MTNKVLASLLILAFALTIAQGQTVTEISQPSIHDWQGLRNLKPGTKLLVETKEGRVIEAKFVDIVGSKLSLSYGFNILSLEQPDIQRAYLQKERSSRKKAAIIGALVGAVAGLTIGTKIGLNIDARNRRKGPPFEDALTTGDATAVYLALGGAAAGYGIGRLLGGKHKGLIYRSN